MNREEFKKIVSFAIDCEKEAYDYYSNVSEKSKDNSIKGIFKDLAAEEKKHRTMLEEFLVKTPEDIHFKESKDYKFVEAMPTPALTADLKPIDGIVIAIKKELDAMQMYTQLANASLNEEKKKLFLELASMERGHKSRLEDIYTNMAFPEAW